MKLLTALQQLEELNTPYFTSNDAKALLKQSGTNTSKILQRLRDANFLLKLKQGLWGFKKKANPLELPEYFCSPMPAYISLQTALFLHNLIEQIPSVFYVVSLARSQKVKTEIGNYSVHHVDINLFKGYEIKENIKIAIPEKALFDLAYFSHNTPEIFSYLPELHLPKTFKKKLCLSYLKEINYEKRKKYTGGKLEQFLC